jgi:hypothetical protein
MTNDDLPPCPAPWIPPEGYEPPAPVRIGVKLGSEVQSFNKGHFLSVADLLDALDGLTERVWTTETHRLVLHRGDETFDFVDPLLNVYLWDGDVFEAVPR